MRMTKLKLEDLVVDSFTTGLVPNAGGTVRANQDPFTGPAAYGMDNLAAFGSEDATCQWTCDDLTCGVKCPTGVNDPECNSSTAPGENVE